MKKKNLKYVLCIGLFALLTGVTFWLLLRGGGLQSLLDALRRARPGLLLAALALALGALFCESLGMRTVLRSEGLSVSPLKSFQYTLIGFYFSGITPSASGGEPVQVYYMSRDRLSAGVSSIALLTVQIGYHIAMLSLAGSLLIWRGAQALGAAGGFRYLFLYGSVMTVFSTTLLILALCSGSLVKRMAAGLARLLGRMRLIRRPDALLEKLDAQLDAYASAARSLRRKPTVLLRVFFCSFCQLTLTFLVPYCVYRAFGLGGLSPFDFMAAQAFVAIAVETLPLPGAVGASETAFLSVYGALFGPLVLPAMVLCRGVSFYGMLLISGGVSLGAHVTQSRARAKADRLQLQDTRKAA